MNFLRALRAFVPLIIGLIVGGVGAILFQQSLPGSAGSPQERASRLEVELKGAQNRIAALEAEASPEGKPRGFLSRLSGGSANGNGAPSSGRALADEARRIAEDLRAGRSINPEDIFRASQPLRRDLAPIFERIRVKQQQRVTDSIIGELSRKYDLAPQAQEALQRWFKEKSNEDAKRWGEFIARDDTRLEDFIRATHDVRPDEGLDEFMPTVLSGEKLASFQAERFADRVQRVQQEADMKLHRLDAIVGLDDAQRDQVFVIFARGSRDYDPVMSVQGALGPIGPTPPGDRQAAILSVLRPAQLEAYQAERLHRRDEAAKEMESIGLSLPPDWEMFEDDDFR